MDGYYWSQLWQRIWLAGPSIAISVLYGLTLLAAILITKHRVNENWRDKPKVVNELVRRELRERDKTVEAQKITIGELRADKQYYKAQLRAAANQNLHTQQILAGERVMPRKGKK